MTGAEAVIQLKLKADKLSSDFFPELADEVAVDILNEGFARFVKQRYGGNNFKKESFEESQKRMDDLRNITVYVPIATSTPSTFYQSAREFALPQDYWFSVIEQIDVTADDCKDEPATSRVGIKAIQHNNVNTVLTDPFNRPEGSDVVRVMHLDNIVVFHEASVTLGTLYLGYISGDFRIDVNDLSPQLATAEHTHSEIVDTAVQYLLENIESVRYQSHMSELSRQE